MDIKPKHEIKHCPRCGGEFVCKVNDVANCQCSEVSLSHETLEYLNKISSGCHCKHCLSEINQLVEKAKSQAIPNEERLLIEGLHYTLVDGKKHYTEFYHILKAMS